MKLNCEILRTDFIEFMGTGVFFERGWNVYELSVVDTFTGEVFRGVVVSSCKQFYEVGSVVDLEVWGIYSYGRRVCLRMAPLGETGFHPFPQGSDIALAHNRARGVL